MSINKFLKRKNLLPSVAPPVGGLFAHYAFEDNANDETGSHNGTATSITYNATGYVGKSAIFNNTTSKIVIPDNAAFSFTDGANDLPFTFQFMAKFYAVSSNVLFVSKAGAGGWEWDFSSTTANLFKIRLASLGSISNTIGREISYTPSLNTWIEFVITYDGSQVNSGLKIYIDKVLQATTGANSGTYVRMNNTTQDVLIGKYDPDTTYTMDGEMDEVKFFNTELSQGEIDLL